MTASHTGACLCGRVRFEIAGTFDDFLLCHCARCRKDTGSAHAANLFSVTAKLHWSAGEDDIRTFRLPSTRHQKSFCATCGSAVPGHHLDGRLLVVPAGSLDGEITRPPRARIFCASRAPWTDHIAQLPTFDALPDG